MKGFFDWFKSSTKVKRWIFLVLLGMILFSFGFTHILFGNRLEPKEIVTAAIAFVVGFTFSVIGLIFIQKRNLEIIIEASEKGENIDAKNVNIKSLIFNKKVYERGPNVVVIGGGAGIASVLEGLKQYTSNIKAIVAVSDYGKNPTISRQDLEIVPLQDVKNSVASLATKEESLMNILLNYEFESGRLKNLNFGDIYFTAMKEIYGNLAEAVEKSSTILNMTGEVLPVTLDEMTICAELENGMVVEEKEKISEVVSEKITKIKRVFVNPTNCRVAPGVIEAIKSADAIIIGPGSLYTNIIPNLLIKNVSKAIKESKGIKIYISNIMTEPGETDNFSVSDHINAIEVHAGEQFINYCISDTAEIVPEFVRKYNKMGSEVVEQDYTKVKQKGIIVIPRNLSVIKGDYIRHDSDMVAASIIELICNELRFRDKQNEMKYLILNNKLKKQKRENPKLRKKVKKTSKREFKPTKSRTKSKFQTKYSERISNIQNSEAIRQRNIEKMNRKAKKRKKTVEQQIVEKSNTRNNETSTTRVNENTNQNRQSIAKRAKREKEE